MGGGVDMRRSTISSPTLSLYAEIGGQVLKSDKNGRKQSIAVVTVAYPIENIKTLWKNEKNSGKRYW